MDAVVRRGVAAALLDGLALLEAVRDDRLGPFLLGMHVEVDEVQEKLQRPLVLLIAAGGAEDHERLAVLEDQRRRQGGSRAFAWGQGVGVLRVSIAGTSLAGLLRRSWSPNLMFAAAPPWLLPEPTWLDHAHARDRSPI